MRERLEAPGAGDIDALLMRRAERLRAPRAEHDDAVCWLAEFQVGGTRCAFRLESLRGAIPLRMVQPVPFSEPHIIGVARFRGEIVTAMSLASLIGIKGWARDPFILVIVECGKGRICAVDCEAIPRPLALAAAVIERAHAGAGKHPALLEVFDGDSDPITLVSLGQLLGEKGNAANDR